MKRELRVKLRQYKKSYNLWSIKLKILKIRGGNIFKFCNVGSMCFGYMFYGFIRFKAKVQACNRHAALDVPNKGEGKKECAHSSRHSGQ
jgi:hypothetical protein